MLPGTAFRQEAAQLGLKYQPRPPYYVLSTPTLGREDLYGLMQEAQDLFEIEFDAQPPPVLDFAERREPSARLARGPGRARAARRRRRRSRDQAFTLWLRSAHFERNGREAAALIRQLLADNPFTTLQVVLEPAAPVDAAAVARQFRPSLAGSADRRSARSRRPTSTSSTPCSPAA